MERLTPAELLRFLEEEANTLQMLNAKIAYQLHFLKVEEELFGRKLSKLENGRVPTVTIDSIQSEQDANDKVDIENELESEIQSERRQQQLNTLIGSDEQAHGPSPTARQSFNQEIVIRSEGLQQQSLTLVGSTEQALRSSPTARQSPDQETEIQIEGLQQESTTLVGSTEPALGSSLSARQGSDQEIVIQRKGLKRKSPTLVKCTEQALDSSPKPQLSRGSRNRSGGDGQELSQITGLENNGGKGNEAQQGPQEVLQVKETAQPHRTSGRRISRRPTRFLD